LRFARPQLLTRGVGSGAKRRSQRRASPAPKANEDLARAKFYNEMAKAKNALALGVKVPGRSTGYPALPPQTRT